MFVFREPLYNWMSLIHRLPSEVRFSSFLFVRERLQVLYFVVFVYGEVERSWPGVHSTPRVQFVKRLLFLVCSFILWLRKPTVKIQPHKFSLVQNDHVAEKRQFSVSFQAWFIIYLIKIDKVDMMSTNLSLHRSHIKSMTFSEDCKFILLCAVLGGVTLPFAATSRKLRLSLLTNQQLMLPGQHHLDVIPPAHKCFFLLMVKCLRVTLKPNDFFLYLSHVVLRWHTVPVI